MRGANGANMTRNLKIALEPLNLDQGLPEEIASFGQLIITAGKDCLTGGIEQDADIHRYRPGPYVSGYHLAEWLVWNWWRLRWEPRPVPKGPVSEDWNFAHCMSAIGEGYIWPNITVANDGFQCQLTAAPSLEPYKVLFRYLGHPEQRTVAFPSEQFERAVDIFVESVIERCDATDLKATNLHILQQDLTQERNVPELARLRKLEALLGSEPDELPSDVLETRLEDAHVLGNNALDELAATSDLARMLPAQDIIDITKKSGFESEATNTVAVRSARPPSWGTSAAWHIGYSLAHQVRRQESLGHAPISNGCLADLAGTTVKALQEGEDVSPISWVFNFNQNGHSRIVLRPRWATGRRFDLARLIADRLFSAMLPSGSDPMLPATRSYSYRQKAQRAFAAELLCPRAAVKEMLGNDYSEENQEQVANYFSVSSMVIANGLQNDEMANLSE